MEKIILLDETLLAGSHHPFLGRNKNIFEMVAMPFRCNGILLCLCEFACSLLLSHKIHFLAYPANIQQYEALHARPELPVTPRANLTHPDCVEFEKRY